MIDAVPPQFVMAGVESFPMLDTFDVSEITGFLPRTPPLTHLPPYFRQWEDAVGRLAQLLKDKRLRKVVEDLPALDFSDETLHTKEEWRRALNLLSGLFQGYVWQEGEIGVPSKVPAVIAVPFENVSHHIGVAPLITYASSVLYNWGLRDPEGPMTGENMYTLVSHTGTEDESWFFILHVQVELTAAPGIRAIREFFCARAEGNIDQMTRCLSDMESALLAMKAIFSKMIKKVNPTTFYVKIRPYLAGVKGVAAFPNGLVYEGVSPEPREFSGASGTQSSLLHSFDAFFGTKFDDETDLILRGNLDYMPTKHKVFVDFISHQPPLRQYIIDTGHPGLVRQFNATVDALVAFRKEHIVLVTKFIINQVSHSVNASLEKTGTGGTSFMPFLKGVRDATAALKIQSEAMKA